MHEHRAVTIDELGIQLPLPAIIGEDVLLVPPGERPNVHAAKGAVDEELGVEAGVAILVGGEGLVVPGERVLQQRPGWPRRAEAARGHPGRCWRTRSPGTTSPSPPTRMA